MTLPDLICPARYITMPGRGAISIYKFIQRQSTLNNTLLKQGQSCDCQEQEQDQYHIAEFL